MHGQADALGGAGAGVEPHEPRIFFRVVDHEGLIGSLAVPRAREPGGEDRILWVALPPCDALPGACQAHPGFEHVLRPDVDEVAPTVVLEPLRSGHALPFPDTRRIGPEDRMIGSTGPGHAVGAFGLPQRV